MYEKRLALLVLIDQIVKLRFNEPKEKDPWFSHYQRPFFGKKYRYFCMTILGSRLSGLAAATVFGNGHDVVYTIIRAMSMILRRLGR